MFGQVGDVLSVLGDKERTNDPPTISLNPSFTARWTCLLLVAIWRTMINDSGSQELANFALDGIKYSRQDSTYVALTEGGSLDRQLSEERMDAR